MNKAEREKGEMVARRIGMWPGASGPTTDGEGETGKLYRVFVRNWYTWGPRNSLTGKRTKLCQPGKKTTLATHCTWAEARRRCDEYNNTHQTGPLSRKAEFEEE